MAKGAVHMLKAIIQNLKEFFDMSIFFVMVFVGWFLLAVDYPFFKRVKYRSDAVISMVLGIASLVMSFILLVISKI